MEEEEEEDINTFIAESLRGLKISKKPCVKCK